MKKRKPPILAVTILCICAAVAFGFNYKAGLDPNAVPDKPAPAPTAEAQVGQPRPTKPVSQTASEVSKQMGAAGAPAPGGPGPRARGAMGPKGPSTIAAFKPGNNKPVPNDSSIASQWYRPSSSKN